MAVAPLHPGRAIFLVGPSSAGKTSLGRELIEILPELYLFFETDRFGLWHPRRRPEFVTREHERAVTSGSALAVRGYLDAGVNLVVERDLWDPSVRAQTAAVFAPYDAWLVGLLWDVTVLEARERARTDGIFPGTARDQASEARRWQMPYDLVVDTIRLAPADAARQLLEWLATRPPPRALREIVGSG